MEIQILLFSIWSLSFCPGSVGSGQYNPMIFVDDNAISFMDTLKEGFRVILTEEFLKKHLGSGMLPTLFVTAIPLKAGLPRFTSIQYPKENVKLLKISGLREKTWYYVCVEWENINRHNNTMGTTCRLYRTLDRFGLTSSNTLSDVEVRKKTDMVLSFRMKLDVDFPLRLTAYLQGGASAPALTYFVKSPATLDVVFPFLQAATDYGKLCVLEEPMVTGYTAAGRLVSGVTREKCYFDSLKTKKMPERPMATEPDDQARAYRRVMNGSASVIPFSGCISCLIIFLWGILQ